MISCGLAHVYSKCQFFNSTALSRSHLPQYHSYAAAPSSPSMTPSSPTRPKNVTCLLVIRHWLISSSFPPAPMSTKSSTYFPYAMTCLPCQRPWPKCTPVKYVVALAETGICLTAVTWMCCVVSACCVVTGLSLLGGEGVSEMREEGSRNVNVVLNVLDCVVQTSR